MYLFYYPLSSYSVYLLYFVVLYCLSTILCRPILFIYYPLSSYICFYYPLSSYSVSQLSFIVLCCLSTILCLHILCTHYHLSSYSVNMLSSVIVILFIYYHLSSRYCLSTILCRHDIVYLLSVVVIYCLSTILCRHTLFIYYPLSS